MTPPPDENGNVEMDPLKWLESLAARQGANPEELITSADLDVPEADPNAVIDEPGYVDYDPFGSGSSRSTTRAEAAPPPAAKPAPKPSPAPAGAGALDETVDPLAWLESLAKRQGANPEEFVTEANLDVPEADPNAVIDEPGYTPYEGGLGAPARAAAPPPPAPEPEFFPEPEEFEPEEFELEAFEPEEFEPEFFQQEMFEPETLDMAEGDLSASEAAALLGLDTDQMIPISPEQMAAPPSKAAPAAPAPVRVGGDPLDGTVDPLAWLESLAKRQGAKSEELITPADLAVPEADANAVIDEPGYVPYSPFGPGAEEPAAAAPPPPRKPKPEPVVEKAPSGGDTLAWLEDLAAEQGAAPPSEPAIIEAMTAGPLAGLSDVEIEQRAAAGELSAEQMEAWLNRQAESLAAHRSEAEEMFAEPMEVEAAAPAEIPSWLADAMPADEMPPVEAAPTPLVEEIAEPPQPADLPDWLAEEAPETAEAELMALFGQTAEAAPAASAEPEIYEDSWAAALEEEYVTMQTGADEEPEWYTAALEDPKRQAALEETIAQPTAGVEAEVAPAEAGEMPDWLAEVAPADAADEDMPDWLTETIPERPKDFPVSVAAAEEAVVAAADIPDWLAEPTAEVAEVPDWLAEVAPQPPPTAKPEPAAAAPPAPKLSTITVKVTAAVPAGAAYDRFRQALQANPADHATRLELARTLTRNKEYAACLGQYEAMIAAEAQLDAVEADLRALAKAKAEMPQVRRVLGDAIMRQGRLQDALDTYRAALEQL